MIPSQNFGETVKSIIATDSKDFSSLMPRPGWKGCEGLWGGHL